MTINFAYKISILLITLFIVIACLLTIPSHTQIIDYYRSILPRFHAASDIGSKFLKPRDYIIFKASLCLYILSALILMLLMIFKKTDLQQILGNIFNDIKGYFSGALHIIKTLSPLQKAMMAAVFMAVITFKVYYCLHTYPYIDEVFSFVGFVNEGPLVTATFYPVPNNHIFNNLICILFKKAGFSPYWTMRLPTLLFWIATLSLLFIYLKPKMGFNFSCFGTLLFALLPNLAFFAFFGRGYQLQVLLFILCIIFSHSIWAYKHNRALIYYIVCSILGCYTAPSYLYCVILLTIYHCFLAVHYKTFRSYIIIATTAIAIGCMYLYLPILSISGIESLFQNEFVRGSDEGWLIFRNFYLLKEVFAAVSLLPMIYILRKRLSALQSKSYGSLLLHTFYLSIACLATFILIQFVSGRLAPERALLWISYLKVWIAIFVIYTIYLFLNNQLKYLLLSTLTVWACFEGYNRHQDAFQNSYYGGYHETSRCTIHQVQQLEHLNAKTIATNDIEFYAQWKFKYPDATNIIFREDHPENTTAPYMVLNDEMPLLQHPNWKPIHTLDSCSKRRLYLRTNSF